MDLCAHIPEVRDGRNMKTRPWKHQVAAIDFLQNVLRGPRSGDGGGAMLAMGMGTGKTLVAVAMACNLDVSLILIIAPLRVVDDVWPAEFAKHAGRADLRVVALTDKYTVRAKRALAAQQLEVATHWNERLVVVVNYESAWRPPLGEWILAQQWGLVILDESHRIKLHTGRASKFCDKLRSRATYRLALTGTPMPHSPLDIWAQFRFLQPGLFPTTYALFRARHCVFGGFNNKQVVAFQRLKLIESTMREITFRVGKEVLDLPPEQHITAHCDLGPEGARLYVTLERAFIAEVEQGVITAANAMVKLLRLQQLTGGFLKTDDGEIVQVDESKRRLLADLLEDTESSEPIVVFCRFREDLRSVHRAAKTLGRESCELSGERNELAAWKAGGAPILAAQIQAGGVGVDLTRARYNIYYSLGYSLGDYDQSLSRVHRPGQQRPVTHYHLIARGTVDEKVMRAIEARQDLVESILRQLKQQHGMGK